MVHIWKNTYKKISSTICILKALLKIVGSIQTVLSLFNVYVSIQLKNNCEKFKNIYKLVVNVKPLFADRL